MIKFLCCKFGNTEENTENLNRTEKLFIKGWFQYQKELDIVNLLNTINKLKAGLSAVMADDTKLMEKTKRFFYSN